MSSSNSDQPFYITFSEEFQRRCSNIRNSLDGDSPLPHDQLQKDVAALSKFLSDSVDDIPTYDQKRYHSEIKELELLLDTKRKSSTGAGTRRFAFKRKTPASASDSGASTPAAPELASSARSESPATSEVTTISNRVMTLKSLSLPSSGTLILENMSKGLLSFTASHVSDSGGAPPKLSNVHLKSLSSCVVVLPDIDGSMTLHSLERCTLIVSCHQLRIHDSKDLTIYLDLPTPDSVPILEHCTNLRFGRHPSSTSQSVSESGSYAYAYVPQDFSNILASSKKNWEFLSVDDLPDLGALEGVSEGLEEEALEGLLTRYLPQSH